MSKHDGHYHFVAHSEQKKWEMLGWEYAYEHPAASAVGSYFKWAGKGEPIYPPPAMSLFEKQEIEFEMQRRALELRAFDEIFGTGGDGE